MGRGKLITLQEAVAGLVHDGDTIAMTAEMDAVPMAVVWEIVRTGKRDLRVVGLPGGGIGWDLLIGAGCVAEAQVCHLSLGPLGAAPNFKRYVEGGRLKVKDNTWGVLLSMLQAGAMGVPFVPVRGLYGSDLISSRDDFMVIDDPYQPGQVVVTAPALCPEVFLTHGAIADREANVITVDEGRNDLLAAQASRRVLVSVEEVSEEPLSPATRPGWIFIPAVYVSAVVVAPRGSCPAGFSGLYPADEPGLQEYAEAGRSDEAFKAYLERRVSPRDGSGPLP